MIIRPAKLTDSPAAIELAVESVGNNPLPLKVDTDAMSEMARALVGNPQHFAWVAEVDGKVVAAVAACTQPGFWFQRLQCSVLMFYSKHPGAGVALLREFARWVKGRPAIKMAVFTLEPGMDPRIAVLLRRLGFIHESPCFTYVRGASCPK